MYDALGTMANGMRPPAKQKSWYVALRYTDMLLQAQAFEKLEEFTKQVPCREEEAFLCGLCSQLEQAWNVGNPTTRDRVLDLIKTRIQVWSKSPRVQEWVRMVAITLEQPDLEDTLLPIQHNRRFWKKEKYESKLEMFPMQRMKPEKLLTDLLEAGWSSCEQAQIYYADTRIREYYTQQQRLDIERLSGQLLPMEQCYINLAIVESISGRNTEDSTKRKQRHLSSPFSLFNRLKVGDSNSHRQVPLAALFDPRKMQDGSITPPRRVLIRGRAGVGKTTLCKKIVYDHIHNQLWSDLFDRVLWVPLQRLKGKKEYGLKKLLSEFLFSQHEEDIHLVRVLSREIRDQTHARTLFILDGLDEVSRQWNSGTHMADFLVDLLNRPNVIITSRPYGEKLPGVDRFDLELETVGFSSDQVEIYLQKTFYKPEDEIRRQEIHSFLQEHWLVQGLVRIPIQLDALCYTWNKDIRSGGGPKTMTALYQAIELKLWTKDISRLEKEHEGKPLNGPMIRTLRTATQIKSIVESESTLLECLAFTGIYNDVIELSAEYRSEIYEHFWSLGFPVFADDILRKLSFLRTSYSASEDTDRSYHFLHLTIQEYFTAQYFVRQWKSDQPLSCLILGGRQKEITPERFLQQEKYNPRFDIVWRFVAGLLQTDRDEKPLLRFFQILEDEPRDLFGPAHQRLFMHCLSEVALSDNKPGLEKLRAEIENRLTRWILFEYDLRGSTWLGTEMEYPEHLLISLLQEGHDKMKTSIWETLARRPRISSTLLHLVVSMMGGNTSDDLERAILRALLHHQKDLPEWFLKVLISLLNEEDPHVRLRTSDAMSHQSHLPEEILKALVSRLEDKDRHVRSNAAYALHRQLTLPEDILKALISQLEDKNSTIRSKAALALGNQSTLPEDILKALVSQLEDKNSSVRSKAAHALGNQSTLPQEILKALVSRLEDKEWHVRSNAAYALRCQSTLPEEILKALVSQLEDENSTVRSKAARALRNQSTLPQEILKALVSQLEDKNSSVRSKAAYALANRLTLPEDILKALASRLEDKDKRVRVSAAVALGYRSNLPEEILKALVSRLEDEDSIAQLMVAGALTKQSTLPDEILKALTLLLCNETEPSYHSERILRRHAAFYSLVPGLHPRYFESLWRIWQVRSFEAQMTCYFRDTSVYFDTPEGLWKVPFEGPNQEMKQTNFTNRIHQAQAILGCPSSDRLSSTQRVSSDRP
jgi:HEAT repeat protein